MAAGRVAWGRGAKRSVVAGAGRMGQTQDAVESGGWGVGDV